MRDRPRRLAVPRSKWAGMSPCLRSYPHIVDGRFPIHNGNPWGNLETEEGIAHSGIKFPVRKLELQLDTSTIAQDNARQIRGGARNLQEYCAFGNSWPKPRSSSGGPLLLRICTARNAIQHDIVSTIGFHVGCGFNAGAKLVQFHLSRKKCQRRSPIRALLCGYTRDGMVRRNIKPRGLAIYEKEVVLWRLVFPSHLSRFAKISSTGFYSDRPPVLAITLQKCCSERACRTIPRFKQNNDRFRVWSNGPPACC